MGRPAKTAPDRFCIHCGERLVRKRYPSGLETFGRFLLRRACGQACANRREIVGVAALRWRAKQHRGSSCERCGATANLHAHHRDGDLENNEPENIGTLCGSCHLKHHWKVDREARMATLRLPGQVAA